MPNINTTEFKKESQPKKLKSLTQPQKKINNKNISNRKNDQINPFKNVFIALN
tara:strand:+ start:1252 stop:1410 length:159 start_codon:yes stop_codon:yes gene_type:complete